MSKKFDKRVKAIVRQELEEETEAKHAICEYADVLMKRTIPSGFVTNGTGSFFKLLPEIAQSTDAAGRAYNTRIGNEIILKSTTLTAAISHAAYAVNANTDIANNKLAFRVMILRAKSMNDVEILFNTNMPTDELIRFGNQQLDLSGNPIAGTGAFGGYTLDAFRAINRDTFSVKYDKIFYVNAPTMTPATNPAGSSAFSAVPSSNRIVKHKISYGKNGLKLKFGNQDDVEANNYPYFMVCGYSSMSSQNRPDDDQVRMTLSCVSEYTDS